MVVAPPAIEEDGVLEVGRGGGGARAAPRDAPFAEQPQQLGPPPAQPMESIYLSEGEQIRLGVGFLGVVWFAFFLVAESRFGKPDRQAELAYLVASASLGLLWSGPLTVLAGMRLYPRTYLAWQPFVGGFVFVLLQAFGWLLYSTSLMFCILAIANIWSVDQKPPIDGGFITLGVLGLAGSVLLNVSLDHFDESQSASSATSAAAVAEGPVREQPPRRLGGVELLTNGKTGVALLLSFVGLLLFLVCDRLRDQLPAASLPIALLPFAGAAIVTQCINGPSQLQGFAPFQPFAGGMSFVLLQAFGWFAFGGVVQTVLLVPSAKVSAIAGILPACGITGFGSQLILLSSLPYFEPPSLRAPPASSLASGSGSGSRSPVSRLRRLASAEVFLSLCLFVWAGLAFVAGYALERGVLEHWPVPANPRGLWALAMLLLLVATPLAHLAGKREHERVGFRIFQPFCGGTMFCVAQGFGWMLYACLALLLLTYSRRSRSPCPYALTDLVVFVVGSAAYTMVAFSLEHYDGLFATGTRMPGSSPGGSSPPGQAQLEGSSPRGSSRPLSAQPWTCEMRASATMVLVAQLTCGCIDLLFAHLHSASASAAKPAAALRLGAARSSLWALGVQAVDPEDVATLSSLVLAAAAALFAISAALVHVGSSRRLRNFHVWMPFHGGDGFVVRQALGWTLMATSQVVFWMLVLTQVEGQRAPLHGLVFGCGSVASLAQYLLLRSIDFFEREQVTVTLSGLADPALNLQGLGVEIALLQRLLASADQPLVSRMLHSILAQLEERAAEASSHGAAARPLNVLLSPRAMQLVNLCLILVATFSIFVADALRSTQPQVAQVLLTTGIGLGTYTLAFSHAFLGKLFHPSYRIWQPFVGSGYYVLLQAVGWTLYGVSLVMVATILYAPIVRVGVDGVVSTVGVVLFLAQLLIAISIFAYKPPAQQPLPAGWSASSGASSTRSAGPALFPPSSERSSAAGRLFHATHGQAIALVMSLSALALFVIADLAPATLGSDGEALGVSTAPIIVCALVALCGSVVVTYLISCTQMPCHLALELAPAGPLGAGAGGGALTFGEADGAGGGGGGGEAAEGEGGAHERCKTARAHATVDPAAPPSPATWQSTGGHPCGEPSTQGHSPSSEVSPELSVVMAARGRFLVSHIFGCALLSFTFLRATLVGLRGFELQQQGQNTLTGIAGVLAILLMLGSQSYGPGRPVSRAASMPGGDGAEAGPGQGVPGDGDEALTIVLHSFAASVLCALSGVQSLRQRPRLRLAELAAWGGRAIKPLSTVALLLAWALHADRSSGLREALSAQSPGLGRGGTRVPWSAEGGVLSAPWGGPAPPLEPHLAARSAQQLAQRTWELALAASRASPPTLSLGALLRALLRVLCPLPSELAAVVAGAVLLCTAAVAARLLLPLARLAAARRQLSAPAAVREALGALGLAELRGGGDASALEAAAHSGRQSQSQAHPLAVGHALSALERLSPQELQDTLGMHLPLPLLAQLSLCSRTLRSRLPPGFWRMRFVQLHGARLGLEPHRPIVPTLAPCSAESFRARGLLLRSCAAPADSLRALLRDGAALLAKRCCPGGGPRPPGSPGLAAMPGRSAGAAPEPELPLSLEGLRWRRACVLADSGATLRYCALCSRLDLDCDRDGPPAAPAHEAGPGEGPRGERSSAAASSPRGSATSAWVSLRCCAPPSVGARGPCAARECVSVHRGCLELRAAAHQALLPAELVRAHDDDESSLFCCPRCQCCIPEAERPVRIWAELLRATSAQACRTYARRAAGFVCVALLALWLLQACCALALESLAPTAAGVQLAREGRGDGARGLCARAQLLLLQASPSARGVLFAVQLGCVLELLASPGAWAVLATAGSSSSEHALHCAYAAALCLCTALELAANTTLTWRGIHPLLDFALPRSFVQPLSVMNALLFFIGTQALLLNGWCARTAVRTPRSGLEAESRARPRPRCTIV